MRCASERGKGSVLLPTRLKHRVIEHSRRSSEHISRTHHTEEWRFWVRRSSRHTRPARSVKHPAAPPPAHVVPQLAGHLASTKQLADVGTRWAMPNRPAPPPRRPPRGRVVRSEEMVPPRPRPRASPPRAARVRTGRREASTPCTHS